MNADSQKTVDYKNISIFQGLNALRFVAAFLVVMHHSETIKGKNGIESFEWLGLFKNGGNAVTFFFVLSGFLITYLLLKESGKTGDVSVKTFYIKRVLRIWPLYYLLVFIGTVGLPFAFTLLGVTYEMPYTLEQTWFYFLFFLPGLVTFFYGHNFLEPLWSIGVEEVFYLIWGPLFKISKNRILSILIAIIGLKTLLNLAGTFVIHDELFTYILSTFKFEAMAIGGLGAYALYTRTQPITQHFIFKVPSQVILFSVMVVYLIFHTNIDNYAWNAIFKTPVWSPLLIEALYLYIIVCVSCAENSIVKWRNKTLSFLGEVSYGIYMYHILIIFATILFLKKYLIQMGAPWNHLLFYGIITTLVIITSITSKYLFENYFLRLKEKIG